ncbi:unnamed protein product [Didymodactylos carnosus]|uniref:Uncharacterized protein n=1 Tax=Didymodactylos carnosus TaxID=1234261 RepID=A0A814NR05_9BILA|nr:unnamed protein product [Didymodactylos carnosus]CAF1094689.1 unnamed protein product [Didymodactylos carnosus]CAF3823833.1 unnamed protein product [Didymodactylos carnosus]CAF3860055.1 unnamed protein product [Didymodactylos carnosus]
MHPYDKYQSQITQALSYPDNLRPKRLHEIKDELESLKNREIIMGSLKTIGMIAFMVFFWKFSPTKAGPMPPHHPPSPTDPISSSNGRVIRGLLLAAAAILLYSGGKNYFNFQKFNVLIRMLKRDHNI